MEISKRLETIASFVDIGDKTADIGTDHGFVPNFLIQKGISDFVIASDISESSLNKSMEFTKEMKNEDKIVSRVGSGLSVLKKGEVNTAIIAGMGGLLMEEIIKSDWDIAINLDKIILQPMQAMSEIRKFLYENKFEIIDEKIIYEDKKFFEIILTKYSGEVQKIDEIFYEIPKMPYLRQDKIIYDYLKNRIEYNSMILKSLEKSKDLKKVEAKIKKVSKFIQKCEELLNEIQD